MKSSKRERLRVDKRHSPITKMLFGGIVDHFWQARDEGIPERASIYPAGYCITYGELVHKTGAGIPPIAAGGYLFHVAAICRENGYAPIHSLVVNKRTKWPGENYKGAPNSGKDFAEWEQKVLQCFTDGAFPRTTPPF